MRKLSAWIFASLLRVLPPARGRHRAGDAPPMPECPDIPTVALPRVPVERRLLRGEDVAFLRPYVLTPEERQEQRLWRGRRRAVWLSSYGVDAGPRRIHGVEVGC